MRLLLGLILSLLTCCTAVQNNVVRGSLTPPKSITVIKNADADGDPRIRTAIENALLQRGMRGGKRITVEFEDTWRWDVVMYLASLNIRFIDSDTGHVFGSTSWRQKGLHVFPSQESAVEDVFKALDKAGAFQP